MYRWFSHQLGNLSVNLKLGIGFGLVLLALLVRALKGGTQGGSGYSVA